MSQEEPADLHPRIRFASLREGVSGTFSMTPDSQKSVPLQEDREHSLSDSLFFFLILFLFYQISVCKQLAAQENRLNDASLQTHFSIGCRKTVNATLAEKWPSDFFKGEFHLGVFGSRSIPEQYGKRVSGQLTSP